jgi:recyclin-1
MRLVDVIMAIEPRSRLVTPTRVQDVVYRMFEGHMDDYLPEEEDWAKEALDAICKEWESKVCEQVVRLSCEAKKGLTLLFSF